MNYGDNDICVFPSSILPGICMEPNFCEPVYVECSEERFRFQFTAHVKANGPNSFGNCGDFKATGFSFREKDDALESAALAAPEFLLHHYGIMCDQYSDLVFTEYWPLYDHLSRHREKSRANLSQLTDESILLKNSIDRSFKLFENSKSLIENNPQYAADASLLDACLNELQNMHGLFSSELRSCTELQRLCLFNRRDNRDCHEAVRCRLNGMDVKLRCISTLKLILDKFCDRAGFSIESIFCHQIYEKCYIAEISLLDASTSKDQPNHLRFTSGNCQSSSEGERTALYRAIESVSKRAEGYCPARV
ncbi:unnamed protein product [Urochloa humidicola]